MESDRNGNGRHGNILKQPSTSSKLYADESLDLPAGTAVRKFGSDINQSSNESYSDLYSRHKDLRDNVAEARRAVAKVRAAHAEKIQILKSLSSTNKGYQVSNHQIEELIDALLIIASEAKTQQFSNANLREKVMFMNTHLQPLASWNSHIGALLRFLTSLLTDPVKPVAPIMERSRSKSPSRKNWYP